MTKPTKSPEEVAQEFGLTYCPERLYHTKRVRKLRGQTFIERLKFLYDHNSEFRINADLLGGVTFALFAAVFIVTILILVIG